MSTSGGAPSCLDPLLGWDLPLISRLFWKKHTSLSKEYDHFYLSSSKQILTCFTSETSDFLQSDISLERSSSGLSLTSLKGLISPPTTR